MLGGCKGSCEDCACNLPNPGASELEDVLNRFAGELRLVMGDGANKRAAGQKPPWYEDDSHLASVFSHIAKYLKGEVVDADSGAHTLVHCAARCLLIALRETGNVPVLDYRDLSDGMM